MPQSVALQPGHRRRELRDSQVRDSPDQGGVRRAGPHAAHLQRRRHSQQVRGPLQQPGAALGDNSDGVSESEYID